MATCTDNPRLGIIGCGARYTGERQHSIARVAWSEHGDGRAHITGSVTQIERLWAGDRMRHPSELPKSGLVIVDGRLTDPDGSARIALAFRARSDETASDGSRQRETRK